MTQTPSVRFPIRAFIMVLMVAVITRVFIVASNSVSFHSDEAVVSLMARHILQGARPTFFYGQAYMGSLDAWLNALGFAVFGESVGSIRIIQSALYLGTVASGMALAWRLTTRRSALITTGLMLAIPSVLLTTYTTATLGGYGETLLLGNILMLLGLTVVDVKRRAGINWFALGLVAGIGWWTNALIAVYALPVAIMIVVSWVKRANGAVGATQWIAHIRQTTAHVLIAVGGFVIGAAPWWIFALQNEFAPLAFLTGGGENSGFAGTDIFTLPFDQRVIGYVLIGLPTLIGLRFPWSPAYFIPVIGVPLFVGVIFGVVQGVRRARWDGRWLFGSFLVTFSVVFLASRFSFDPTGRYFLPLAVPIAVLFGALISTLTEHRRWIGIVVISLLVGYQAAGLITTATTQPGFTTQFNLDTHIANTDDAALIAFLDDHALYNGYTQYWIAFRLAFLSGERMQYSATLPYLPSLKYTPLDERYPPYRAAADGTDRIALIIAETTPNLAPIRAGLEGMLAARAITYTVSQIGVYRVYYDFTPTSPRPPFEL